MTISLSKNQLLSKLRVVSKAIRSSKELVYSSFLVEIEKDNAIKITGSDEAGRIETSVDCMISDYEEMKFLLDASSLMNGLKELPEQPIQIIIQENIIIVKYSNKYSNGKFEIAKHDASLYPNIKAIETDPVEIDSEKLGKGFSTVAKFAAINDTLRPIMSSINMSFKDGGITFAGTTGKALSIFEAAHPGLPDFNLNVPERYSKIITDLLPEDGSVRMKYNDRNASFEIEDYTVTYRLVEGRYPNFRSVIPQIPNLKLKLDCNEIISVINRVSFFADNTLSLVSMDITHNNVTFESKDEAFSQSAKESIAIDHDGDSLAIGFDSRLLADIIKTIQAHSKEFTIEFSGHDRAAIFRPADFIMDEDVTIILMPLALNS